MKTQLQKLSTLKKVNKMTDNVMTTAEAVTTEETRNIRFVHATNLLDTTRCPYSGITIAYERKGSYVAFAYGMCMKEDNYVKEFGRELTKGKLEKLLNESGGYMFHSPTGINKRARVGVVSEDSFKNAMAELDIFSDQCIENMDMFSFKHSAISRMLIDFIYNYDINTRYHNSRICFA